MCKAMSEGGQRCASHTRDRLAKRSEVLRQAVESGDPDALAMARSAWEDAAAEYASTTEGKASMDATRVLARESGDLHTEALMTSLIQRGEAIKAANREAGTLLAAARLAGAAPAGQPSLSASAVAGSTEGVRASLATPQKSVGLTRALSALSEDREVLAPQVRAFRVGWDKDSTMTMTDLMQGLDERVATVTDPEATASELRAAAKRTTPYLLTQHHQWIDTPYSEERQRALMAFQNSLAEAEAEVLKMALDHPAADDDLAATIVATGRSGGAALDRTRRLSLVAEHPTTTDERLGRVLPLDEGKVSARAQERIRLARLTQPRLAIHAAMWDTDTMHREAAFDQVISMPLNTVRTEDRVWLAENLDRLPTNIETRRTLARSLAEYAREYGGEQESQAVAQRLATHPDVEISGRLADLAVRRPEPVPAGAEKRGWFGR